MYIHNTYELHIISIVQMKKPKHRHTDSQSYLPNIPRTVSGRAGIQTPVF